MDLTNLPEWVRLLSSAERTQLREAVHYNGNLSEQDLLVSLSHRRHKSGQPVKRVNVLITGQFHEPAAAHLTELEWARYKELRYGTIPL